ncbi:MAG: 6-carboxytetrahydropterin synthase, partial [Candidatus Micrarchaeaceae archaeon]
HMLIDFGELDKIFKEEVYDFLDHAFLIWKDDPNVETYKKLGSKVRILDYSPTVEYLAEFIYNKLIDRIPDLAAVEVVESMDNAATWKVGI